MAAPAPRRLGDPPPAGLLDPPERMSVDELRALQLERLQWTLRHAYENVPHYRASFEAAGVHPDDCRELSDLAKFPTTSKADLRENYPFGMFAAWLAITTAAWSTSVDQSRSVVTFHCDVFAFS